MHPEGPLAEERHKGTRERGQLMHDHRARWSTAKRARASMKWAARRKRNRQDDRPVEALDQLGIEWPS